MKQGKQPAWPRRAAWAARRSPPGSDADLAKLHEQTLVAELLPASGRQTRRAHQTGGKFFCRGDSPLEKTNASTQEAAVYLRKVIETLSQRTVELAASNLELSRKSASARRRRRRSKKRTPLLRIAGPVGSPAGTVAAVVAAILSAQEEERREISRELHDVIAQTLTGINVRLSALAKEAATNTAGLDRNIASTQKLVEKSVDIVHRSRVTCARRCWTISA